MFIRSIGIGLAGEKVTLGRDFLRGKKHFEKEREVSFYRARPGETPATLAVHAARDAIGRGGIGAGEIDAVIYAKSLVKDYESWSMSAEISNRLGIERRMFLDIYQGCDGMIAAADIARDLLTADEKRRNILIVTSQVLPPRFGSHEQVDTGTVLSDGASAMVIARDAGAYKILSIRCDYDATLNDMIKLPNGGFCHIMASETYEPWTITEHKDAYWGDFDKGIEHFHALKRDNILRAIESAGLAPSDVGFVMIHNYSRLYNSPIDELFPGMRPERRSDDVGMRFSHVGASDVVVNLDAMQKEIGSGEVCLLHQDGAGFSFGTMIIRKR